MLEGGLAEAVAALKQDEGNELHVIGSTQLVQTLVEHDLVDEFRLMIDRLVLGGGKRSFRDDGALKPLRLVDSQVTSTGVIVTTCAPAGPEPAASNRPGSARACPRLRAQRAREGGRKRRSLLRGSGGDE